MNCSRGSCWHCLVDECVYRYLDWQNNQHTMNHEIVRQMHSWSRQTSVVQTTLKTIKEIEFDWIEIKRIERMYKRTNVWMNVCMNEWTNERNERIQMNQIKSNQVNTTTTTMPFTYVAAFYSRDSVLLRHKPENWKFAKPLVVTRTSTPKLIVAISVLGSLLLRIATGLLKYG